MRGAAIVALIAAPRAAAADCAASFEASQRLRMSAKLIHARQEAIACADASCPAWMQKECASWVEELDRTTPSVVVNVIGRDGCDARKANVAIDGNVVASELDGKPIALDPGQHVVRVEGVDLPRTDRSIVVGEGEQRRRVDVRFAAPDIKCGAAASPTAMPHRGPSAPAIALAITGAVFIQVGAVFEVWSLAQKPTFERCAPSCNADDVQAWETRWRVGDVLVGAGIASLAVATAAYFASTRGPAKRARIALPGGRF
jgi:hypothetical protein